jgi:hypothetical protein
MSEVSASDSLDNVSSPGDPAEAAPAQAEPMTGSIEVSRDESLGVAVCTFDERDTVVELTVTTGNTQTGRWHTSGRNTPWTVRWDLTDAGASIHVELTADGAPVAVADLA